jgi:LAO/AO transport system kinase
VTGGGPASQAPRARRRELTTDELVRGVRAGDRAVLARAITLIESNRRDHHEPAQELLQHLLPHTGGARRVGITGVPGVGKSTFIDSLGTWLTERGQRVAVLAVDPSSALSGGSILGDKTRMERLSVAPQAFIRPSPSGGSLGGVARKTRESLLVCEAAGFDVVLVETVGVGQSETVVAGMVDFFLVLLLAGAGDELQGVKRGILELADLLAINKADGDNLLPAQRARRQYESALELMRPPTPTWRPRVLTCSARDDQGLDAIWAQVEAHRAALQATGELDDRRRHQLVRWMWSLVEDRLTSAARANPQAPQLERDLLAGRTTPTLAARAILMGSFGLEG